MTTGDRIREARQEKGLSQEQLGALIGVQKAAIHKYENNIVINLKRDTIEKLAGALGVSPAHLMGFEDDTPAPAVFNKRLHDMRVLRGLTLLEMAERLGVKEATMQRYESGVIKNIKHETIVAMADILGCTPAYLMGWDDALTSDAVQDDGLDEELRTFIEKLKGLDAETLLAIEKIVDSILAQRGQ